MASIMIKAENLAVGDTLLLPFGKTATVQTIEPVGPRTRFVKFRTEHGKTRVEVGTQVSRRSQGGLMKPTLDKDDEGRVVFGPTARFVEEHTPITVMDADGNELTVTGMTYMLGNGGVVVQLKARKGRKAKS